MLGSSINRRSGRFGWKSLFENPYEILRDELHEHDAFGGVDENGFPTREKTRTPPSVRNCGSSKNVGGRSFLVSGLFS